MELSDLTAYALDKYRMKEERRWADLPGCSVLCHPKTGKWVAVLMRQWDTDSGTELQRCDLRCEKRSLPDGEKPYLLPPVRMKGAEWIGIAFNKDTESDVVLRLFDEAVASAGQHGYTIMLGSQLKKSESAYRETPLPAMREAGKSAGAKGAGQICHETTLPPMWKAERNVGSEGAGQIYHETPLPPVQGDFFLERMPEKLRKMRWMYEYGRESAESRAKNFYRQGIFMRDYEDDYPWEGHLMCYYPTYHDLTTKQLRGYFSWRTRIRRGEYRPISVSAAYIYIYELLNGIGTVSPEESLQKLKEFEAGFLDAGYGDGRMRSNLRQWMLEYAIIKGLPAETVLQYADQEQVQRDMDLVALKSPDTHTDEEVCAALFRMAGRKPEKSPVMDSDLERGRRLFARTWRSAAAGYYRQDQDLFTLCFGRRRTRSWSPLSNAVVYLSDTRPVRGESDFTTPDPSDASRALKNTRPVRGESGFPAGDREYALNECRAYRCTSGSWQVEAYEKLYFDREFLRGFLHETDALFRRYLKTGRYLRENEKNKWAAPYAAAVIKEDRQAAILAARPKVTIDLSGLWQIRRDALETQNSLLIEEEPGSLSIEADAAEMPEDMASVPEVVQGSGAADLSIDDTHLRILRTLLSGGDVSEIIQGQRLMPSIVADAINEALYDEIGDTVVSCDDEKLALVEDYIEELEDLLL